MQSEKGKLIIHTGSVPDAAFQETRTVRWKSVRHPLQRRRFGLAPKKSALSVMGMEGEAAVPGKGARATGESEMLQQRAEEEARAAFDRAKEALARANPEESLSSGKNPARLKMSNKTPAEAPSGRAASHREALKRERRFHRQSRKFAAQTRRERSRGRFKMSFSERLLRNSAVACALMLGILAVRNLDVPWARAAVGGIERALTMRIDLDESLGKLSFVRALMPESVLVFFDLSDQSAYERPVDGTLTQIYSEARPYLEFECAAGSDVRAADAGEILMVTRLSGGDWGVMIGHGDGKETVYAYLSQPEVEVGQKVERGQKVGASAGESVYFELRSGGEPCDPTELLGF